MKTRNILLSLTAVLSLASCVRDLNWTDASGECEAVISVGSAEVPTRSAAGTTESELTAFENNLVDLTLFRFLVDGSGETLDEASYYDLSSGSGTTRTISVSGKKGKTYRYYALVNCGDRSSAVGVGSAPSALEDIVVSDVTIASMKSGGIPMVNRDGVSVTFGTNSGVTTMPVTRMASRWDFRLDQSGLSNTQFSILQLKLRQSPNRIRPFATANAATSSSWVQDGDSATSGDLNIVSSNGATFYVLENACGELMPTNTDPWKKVPSSGTSVDGYYPTYIEMAGQLVDKSGELQRTSYYRMYLGENTTTNFDVERGTKYTLTFKPTEEPITDDVGDEWKCELYNTTDDRRFQFEADTYVIPYGSYITFKTINEKSSYGITYRLSCSGATLNSSSKRVTNNASSYRTGTLYAYFWDGKLADKCSIILAGATQSPRVLCIESNDVDVQSSGSWHNVHDPDCRRNHYYHDPLCTLNHSDHVAGNFVDIADCPNYIDDSGECDNLISVYSSSMSATAEVAAYIATDLSVDSDGNLKAGNIDTDTELYSLRLGSLTDSSLGIEETADSPHNDIHYEELSNGHISFGAQYQESGYTHWTLGLGHYNLTGYTFPVTQGEGFVNPVPDGTYSVGISSAGKVQQYTMTYSGHASEQIYILSNYVQFVNLTHTDYSNTFVSGDTMMAVALPGAPSSATVYFMRQNGEILLKTTMSTQMQTWGCAQTGAWADNYIWLYSGFASAPIEFTLNGVSGKVASNAAGSGSAVTLKSSDYTITNYGHYARIQPKNYQGYYYFDLTFDVTIDGTDYRVHYDSTYKKFVFV